MKMASPYQKTFPITWEQVHRDAKNLAGLLLEKKTFKSIIAVARGGLVPAAIIARELNIRMIETVCIASFDWQTQLGTETIIKGLDGDGEDCLVIDDLSDTGRTAQVVREMLPKAHIATLYSKPTGKVFVDSFITEVSQDTWILFPWDSEIQYAKPLSEIKI